MTMLEYETVRELDLYTIYHTTCMIKKLYDQVNVLEVFINVLLLILW
jgi:hypothetical protein